MKKITAFVCSVLAWSAVPTAAQDCSGYYYAIPGTSVELSVFDRKGNPSGRSTYQVKDVKKTANSLDALVSSTVYDGKGKEVAAARDIRIQCQNGAYQMDMKNFVMPETMSAFKNTEVNFSGSMLEYPASLRVGATLGDAQLQMDPVSMPMMKTTLTLSNRKVIAQESVTTPAGTFDCYKITYDANVKSLIGINYQVTEWFKPGFGVVRTENYRNGKLMGSTVLSKFGKSS